VVLFAPLTVDEVREVTGHYLLNLKVTLAKDGKTIRVEDEALELIVKKGYSLSFGARFLKRVIDDQIKLPISERWKDASHFDVKAIEGKIVVEPAPARLLTASDVLEFGHVA
jgi:ATP-dependent Clp protease ATP-binding subunit ClpA